MTEPTKRVRVIMDLKVPAEATIEDIVHALQVEFGWDCAIRRDNPAHERMELAFGNIMVSEQ